MGKTADRFVIAHKNHPLSHFTVIICQSCFFATLFLSEGSSEIYAAHFSWRSSHYFRRGLKSNVRHISEIWRINKIPKAAREIENMMSKESKLSWNCQIKPNLSKRTLWKILFLLRSRNVRLLATTESEWLHYSIFEFRGVFFYQP